MAAPGPAPSPGRPTEEFFDTVAYQSGWYDRTATAGPAATWPRRFAGHPETGAARVSG